jgi:gamma-glutamyl:cysteine ligase YbdK (ATP-grasp superfamily)
MTRSELNDHLDELVSEDREICREIEHIERDFKSVLDRIEKIAEDYHAELMASARPGLQAMSTLLVLKNQQSSTLNEEIDRVAHQLNLAVA